MAGKRIEKPELHDSDVLATHRELPASTINAVQAPMVREFFKASREYDLGLRKVAYTASGQLNGNENFVLGAAFEEHHRGTFAMDAAAKGVADKVEVATDRSAGNRGSILPRNDQRADIMIKTDDGTTLIQAKSRAEAAQTNADLANPKYDGVEKLGPSDHVESGQRQIKQKVAGKDLQSKQLTREQNEKLARDIRENGKSELGDEFKSEIKKEMAGRNAIGAAKQAAVVSAVLSGTIEIVNLVRLANERELTMEDLQQALVKICTTTVDATVRAGLTVYVSQSFAHGVGGAMGIAACTNVAYDLAKDLFNFSQGAICLDQVGINVLRNSVCTGTAFAAGAAGQALGAASGAAIGTALATSTLVESLGLGATIGSAAGPVGAVAGAVLFGLAASIGVNSALANQSRLGRERVTKDLDMLRDSLQSDDRFVQMRLRTRAVGHMAPIPPQGWRDLVPFLNIFGDMDEFMIRKRELTALRVEAERVEQQSVEWRINSIREIDIQAESMRTELLGKFEMARQELGAHSRLQLAGLASQLHQYQLCYQIQTSLLDQHLAQDREYVRELQLQRIAGQTRFAAKSHLLDQMQSLPDALGADERQRDLLKLLAKKIASDSLGPQRRYVSVDEVLVLLEGKQ